MRCASRLHAVAGGVAPVAVCVLGVVGLAKGQGLETANAAGNPGERAAQAGAPADQARTPTSDDLLIFEDVPKVVSASRRAERAALTPIPVSVVTAEDIRLSGRTRLPEILRFVPGMSVFSLDRNRYGLGVRGMADEFSDRTLMLIDGQNAQSAIFGGTLWTALPISPLDIEQVEVVRGPGGAVWGANAFSGVVNVITRKPEKDRGVELRTQWNTAGDNVSQFRIAQGDDDFSFSLSGNYTEYESSSDALSNDGLTTRDFARGPTLRGETFWKLGDRATLRAGGAFSHLERGDFEYISFFPRTDERLDVGSAYVRLERTIDERTSYSVQWAGQFEDINRPSLLRYTANHHDLAGQLQHREGGLELTLGGNVRILRTEAPGENATDLRLEKGGYDETIGGAFAAARWKLSERWTADLQARVDHYSATGWDWSGRATALYALDDDEANVLRFSAARAFRAPFPIVRDVSFSRGPLLPGPFPPGTRLFAGVPSDNLTNESVYSVETGYSSQIANGLSWRVDGYLQRMEDLIGIGTLPAPTPLTVFTLDNFDGGNAYGAETELALTGEAGRLSVWYTFHEFSPDDLWQDVRAFQVGKHNVGVSARVNLPADLVLNADYRFQDGTARVSTDEGIKPMHALDVALTWRLPAWRTELQIGVKDVFDTTGTAVQGYGVLLPAQESLGRTLFIGANVRF
jgi:outer membrane receptor protein involved in Fe transport